jgi:hypothetical protein
MSKNIELAFDTYVQAIKNWDDTHNVVSKWKNKWPSFSNGIKEFLNWDPNDATWANKINSRKVWIPEHTYHKFNLLAGPYAATWIKIYYIRKKDRP